MVGAEPASDIPGANPDSVSGNPVDIFISLSRKAFVKNNGRRHAGGTYRFLSRSVSTELRRWRLICVTRAWMSLPGKEPAPSLPESHTKNSGPQRGVGACQGVWDYLTVSVISRLETPRKRSTLSLTSSAKPPETVHRQKWSGRSLTFGCYGQKAQHLGESQPGQLAAFH